MLSSTLLKPKIEELDSKFEIDALVFAAVSSELSRLKLYRRLISSNLYGLQGWREIIGEVNISSGGRALIATKGLGKDKLDALKRELSERGKALY